MAGNEQENEWVESVLNSARGKHSLPADPLFYDKVKARLNNNKPDAMYNIAKYGRGVAAAAVILLAVNVLTMARASKQQKNNSEHSMLQTVKQDFDELSAY
jgi:hypothetical protein